MLSVINAKFHLCCVPFVLSVVMLNVVILSVIMLCVTYAECRK
jgi:hypothetical protein